jgi:predicted transposase/invertase (TIGR01784 family)
MQNQRRPALRERALYYWARLFSGQLRRGDPYTALRRCVVVMITDFAELKSERFHSIFQVHERHGGELLTDHLELHLLELPKLTSARDRNDEPS